MSAFYLVPLVGIALGFATGWLLPQAARPLAALSAVVVLLVSFAVAYFMYSGGEPARDQRFALAYVVSFALAFLAGSTGFAVTDDGRKAILVSVVLAGSFMLLWPITGLFVGCYLGGMCP